MNTTTTTVVGKVKNQGDLSKVHFGGHDNGVYFTRCGAKPGLMSTVADDVEVNCKKCLKLHATDEAGAGHAQHAADEAAEAEAMRSPEGVPVWTPAAAADVVTVDGPPAGHVQLPGTKWTPSDPQQVVDPAAFAAGTVKVDGATVAKDLPAAVPVQPKATRAAARNLTRHLEQAVATGQVEAGKVYTLGQLAKMDTDEYRGAKVSQGALKGRVGTPGKEAAGWVAVPGKPLGAKYVG